MLVSLLGMNIYVFDKADTSLPQADSPICHMILIFEGKAA